MAITTLVLIVTCTAIVSAASRGAEDNVFQGFAIPRNPSFGRMAMPPQFPNMPNIMIPMMPAFHNPFFPSIPFLTENEIKNTKPKPGQTYSGMYVSSNGHESKLLANVNGKVFEEKFSHKSGRK